MAADDAPLVVVGAGQAGLQVCDSLRKLGYAGRLVLCGDEPSLPYQRPPLSKKFLTGAMDAERLLFRPASYYDKLGVEVRIGTPVRSLNPGAQTVTLADGTQLNWSGLALTTGTRVRHLNCAGAAHSALHYLRTLADARALAQALTSARRVVVVGGGFIGLEVAAVARELGAEVLVVEALERLMARAVSPVVSAFYADLHRGHGVQILCRTGIAAIHDRGAGVAVELDDGTTYDADIVVAGIGVVANDELARAAGLACNNGIVVDAAARTSDPDIVAAGDCTFHHNGFLGRSIRLESVQNAVDQAKVAAATLAGQEAHYQQVPWFWSDQYDIKLQMAGIGMPCERQVVRGDIAAAAFSVFYFGGGRLLGADSVNRPAEHMACRKLLAQGTMLSEAQAADPQFDLAALARG